MINQKIESGALCNNNATSSSAAAILPMINQLTRQNCSSNSNSAFTPKFINANNQMTSEVSKLAASHNPPRFMHQAESTIVRQGSIIDQQ